VKKISDGKMVTGSSGYGGVNYRVACSNGRNDESNEPPLHANLATPPLTPPREVPLKEPPVNVNRNNVSDSVHVKVSRFSATMRQGGVVSNGIASGDHLKGHRQNGIPGHLPPHRGMDSEPPALVTGMNEESQEEVHEGQEGVAYSKEASEISRKEPLSHSRERNEWSEVEKIDGRGARHVKEQTGYSSADGDNVSVDDDEVEEMDLVLVEDDVDEGKAVLAGTQHVRQGNEMGVKMMEAESSTSSSPSSYPQSSSTIPNENGHVVPPPPAAAGSAGTLPFSREGSSGAGKRDGEQVSIGIGHSDEAVREARKFPRSGASYPGEVDRPNANGFANHQGGGVVSSVGANKETLAVAVTTTGHQLESHNNNGGSKEDGNEKGEGAAGMGEACSRRAAKVKQFFSTIQQCANGLGREVAEQVGIKMRFTSG